MSSIFQSVLINGFTKRPTLNQSTVLLRFSGLPRINASSETLNSVFLSLSSFFIRLMSLKGYGMDMERVDPFMSINHSEADTEAINELDSDNETDDIDI